jgi:hypothetical protein
MQKALTWISIIALALVGGRALLEKTFSGAELHSAQERVRGVLDGLKSGGDRQKSLGLWYRGTLSPPTGFEELGRAADAFERWCRERRIGTSISGYEVGEAVMMSEGTPQVAAVVQVSGSIDGQPFKMRVQKDVPIAWD